MNAPTDLPRKNPGLQVTAIILCGGKGRRFGGDKGMLTVGGRTVMDRVMERLTSLSDQVLLVTSPEKVNAFAGAGVEVLMDAYPGKGPLGGIYTGLTRAKHPRAILVGCDMPFLNTRLLRHMVDISDGFDAVIPRLDNGMIESLHAVYSRTCLPTMKERIERDELAIYGALAELRVRYVEKPEWLAIDPEKLSFFNINYPEDLEKANEIAREVDQAER